MIHSSRVFGSIEVNHRQARQCAIQHIRQNSSLKLLSSGGRTFILDTTLQEMHTRLLSTPPKSSNSLISYSSGVSTVWASLWHLISRLLQSQGSTAMPGGPIPVPGNFCVCLPCRSLMPAVLIGPTCYHSISWS